MWCKYAASLKTVVVIGRIKRSSAPGVQPMGKNNRSFSDGSTMTSNYDTITITKNNYNSVTSTKK